MKNWREEEWWKKESVYQIYPLSFFDDNNDGFGDIKGIIKKIEYIKKLGFGAIWICPIFNSPMKDNGYDVSDFYSINPKIGTMSDFENLIKKCKSYNIKVILDLPLNHVSSKSKWFIESEINPGGKYGNYFVWRNEPIDGFSSPFELNPWTFSNKRKQYYLHQFSKDQPDLNWENPEIADEFIKIINFWIKKGISGVRLDVLDMIGKKVDEAKKIVPENVHRLIKYIRKNTWNNDKTFLSVGECWSAGKDEAIKYTDKASKELTMVFAGSHNFMDEEKNKWDRKPINFINFKKSILEWQVKFESTNSWNSIFLENHDFPRSVSRFLDDNNFWEESSKAIATLILTLKGTPFIFQGQEIGTTNSKYSNLNEINDIETINWYKKIVKIDKKLTEKSFLELAHSVCRDNGRKPFQWNKDLKNCGFSEAKPWIKIYPKPKKESVSFQEKLKNSILSWYKTLIKFKKESPLLQEGSITPELINHKLLFAFSRKYKDEELFIYINWFETKIKIERLSKEEIFLSSNSSLDEIREYGVIISKTKIKEKKW